MRFLSLLKTHLKRRQKLPKTFNKNPNNAKIALSPRKSNVKIAILWRLIQIHNTQKLQVQEFTNLILLIKTS